MGKQQHQGKDFNQQYGIENNNPFPGELIFLSLSPVFYASDAGGNLGRFSITLYLAKTLKSYSIAKASLGVISSIAIAASLSIIF